MKNLAPDKKVKQERDTTAIGGDSPPDSIKIGGISPGAFLLTFFIMLGFWIVFSGKFDAFHIGLGVVSSLIVAALSSDLLIPEAKFSGFWGQWLRFAAYIPWMLHQVFKANIHVLRLAFHPRMRDLIDPQIVEFQSKLESEVSRTTLANSITLTPGTITVHVGVMGNFVVHCIDETSAKSLPGEMEERVRKIFYG